MPRVKRIPPKKLHPSKFPLLSGSGLGIGASVGVEEEPAVVVVIVVVVVELVVVEADVVVEIVVDAVVIVVVVVVVVVVEEDEVSGAGDIVVEGSSPSELQSEAVQVSSSLGWLVEGAWEGVSTAGLASLGPAGIAAANPSRLKIKLVWEE